MEKAGAYQDEDDYEGDVTILVKFLQDSYALYLQRQNDIQ